MGRPKSAERLSLEKLLSDQAWHDKEEIFLVWSETLHPAKAHRAANKTVASSERKRDITDAQKQIYGARHIFNRLMGNLRNVRRIEERRTTDGSTEIRFIPEEATANLDNFTSIIVLNETDTAVVISKHDPRDSTLVVSIRQLENWSDAELEKLITWCSVREDDHGAYYYAKLLARKVLKTRNAEFRHQSRGNVAD